MTNTYNWFICIFCDWFVRHPTRHMLIFHQIFSVQFIFCYESSSVDSILIVGLTFVVAGVFWHCRIDFHLAFESIFSKSPLSYLKYQMIISFPSPLRRKIFKKHLSLLLMKLINLELTPGILTPACSYPEYEFSSSPSFSHIMLGLGFPVATHTKFIFRPRWYLFIKWDDFVMRAP